MRGLVVLEGSWTNPPAPGATARTWQRERTTHRTGDHEAKGDDAPHDRRRADPDRVAEDEDAAQDRGEVGGDRGEGDDGHARGELEPASRGVEGQHRSRQCRQCPLADDPLQPSVQGPGEVLQGDVGHPEQHAGRDAKQQPLRGWAEAPTHRYPDQRGAERKDTALHGDQRRERVVTQRARVRPAGERDHGEPGGRDDHAGPLPASQSKAEVALGEHREKDQPAREHGLHNRQRRQGKRAYMKPPRNNRDRPAQARTSGSGTGPQRCAADDALAPGRQQRTALLEQERDARAERRAHSQRQTSNHRRSFSPTVAVMASRHENGARPAAPTYCACHRSEATAPAGLRARSEAIQLPPCVARGPRRQKESPIHRVI